MSLRGSVIKAALAQLSQRCQVMLIRLTEKEIKQYTRRKPLKRLQYSTPDGNSTQPRENHIKEGKLPQNGNSIIIPSKCNAVKIDDYKLAKSCSTLIGSVPKTPGSERSKLGDNQRKKKKREELMKELFGEDVNETITCEETHSGVKEINDKEVNNYLSTTVNVNIYNSDFNRSFENNNSVIKRKSHTDNALLKSRNNSSKRLRIDVSLSNKESLPFNEKRCLSDMIPKESSCFLETQEESKSKSSQNHSTCKSRGKLKKKPNKVRKRSSKKVSTTKNVNCADEHPSIKELWNIFGMESPTERTAKYLSAPMNNSSFDTTITLHNDSGETSVTETRVNKPQFDNIAHTKSTNTIKETYTKSVERSASSTQYENTSETNEPFLKITDSFSLAENPTQECNGMDYASPSVPVAEERFTRNYEKPMLNQGPNSTKKCTSGNVIETISLDDDNDHHIETTGISETAIMNSNQDKDNRKKSEEGNSKIGTIRVKSLGMLMNPQIEPIGNENITKTVEPMVDVTPVSNLEDQDSSSNLIPQSVEERFFTTYAYYFDELVESKIPKLGELLHLAIADAIRWTGRIKRAEQLSSEDLIKEEKERAEKDFSDMMKIRGIEFTPLCDIIVKRFEKGSKITLFISLFCRILKHAETIDTANGKYISEARNVISLMLKKHQYKDNDILEALQNNEEEFKDQVNRIMELLEKCFRLNNTTTSHVLPSANTGNNIKSKLLTTKDISHGTGNPAFSTNGIPRGRSNAAQTVCEISQGSGSNAPATEVSQGKDNTVPTATEVSEGRCNPAPAGFEVFKERCNPSPSINEVSQRKGNPNYRTFRISEESYKRIQEIMSKQNGAHPITVKTTRTNNNVAQPVIQCETQQPLMHQPTNPSPDKRISYQETSCKTTHDNVTKNVVFVDKLRTALEQNPKTSTPPTVPGRSINMNNTVSNLANRNPTIRNQLILAKTKAVPCRINSKSNQQLNIASVPSSLPCIPQTTSALVSLPSQTSAASSSFVTRVSAPRIINNMTGLQPSGVFNTTNIGNISVSQQFVNTSPQQLSIVTSPQKLSTIISSQQSSTVTSPQLPTATSSQQSAVTSPIPQPSFRRETTSVALPGINPISFGQQQKTELLIRRQSGLNHTNSIAPIIVRNMVNSEIPAVVSMDRNHLRFPENNITNNTFPAMTDRPLTAHSTASAPTAVTGADTPNNSSLPTPSTPEITSPTAEVNLPSSSHCHPFIARRPISGKMKMLFGNNSNN